MGSKLLFELFFIMIIFLEGEKEISNNKLKSKYGISNYNIYKNYVSNLEELDIKTAKEIYEKEIFNKFNVCYLDEEINLLDNLPLNFSWCLFDSSVHLGFENTIGLLEKTYGFKRNKRLDYDEIFIIINSDHEFYFNSFKKNRLNYYKNLVKKNNKYERYFKGWVKRMNINI